MNCNKMCHCHKNDTLCFLRITEFIFNSRYLKEINTTSTKRPEEIVFSHDAT